MAIQERKLTPKQEAMRKRAQERRRQQIIIVGIATVFGLALLIFVVALLSQPTNFDNIPATATVDSQPFELGAADAKVVIEEYADFQCPACKRFHETTQNDIVNSYIKAGKSVKLVYRPFPFLDNNTGQRESHVTAEGAYCASDQNRFWDFANALYDNQPNGENTGFWSSDRVKALAKSLKLDTDKFNSCYDSGKFKSKVTADFAAGRDKGISGTPTLYFNGKKWDGAYDFATVQKAVDEILNKQL